MAKFFLAFQVLGVLASWFAKATADGKITSAEAVELVNELAAMMGFTLEWDIGQPVDRVPPPSLISPPDFPKL